MKLLQRMVVLACATVGLLLASACTQPAPSLPLLSDLLPRDDCLSAPPGPAGVALDIRWLGPDDTPGNGVIVNSWDGSCSGEVLYPNEEMMLVVHSTTNSTEAVAYCGSIADPERIITAVELSGSGYAGSSVLPEFTWACFYGTPRA